MLPTVIWLTKYKISKISAIFRGPFRIKTNNYKEFFFFSKISIAYDQEMSQSQTNNMSKRRNKTEHLNKFAFVMFCARPFIDALLSPAGKGLTAWLSFVMSRCEVFTFPLVSWVRCGA